MTSRTGGKMLQYINWRMRVTLADTRTLIGTFIAFDKHMNIVLCDTQEYRLIRIKRKKSRRHKSTADAADGSATTEDQKHSDSTAKNAPETREEKRTLGMVMIRGENVISISAEAPPPPKQKSEALMQKASSVATTIGRGHAPSIPAGFQVFSGAPTTSTAGPAQTPGVARGAIPVPPPGAFRPLSTANSAHSVRGPPPPSIPGMPPGFIPGMPPNFHIPGMPLPPPGISSLGRGFPMPPTMPPISGQQIPMSSFGRGASPQ